MPLPAVVAAIKTGRLSGDRPPALKRLIELPFFGGLEAFVYYGEDRVGRRVYAFWCHGDPVLLRKFFSAREILLGEEGWKLRPVPEPGGGIFFPLFWCLGRAGCPLGRWFFWRSVVRYYSELVRFAEEA